MKELDLVAGDILKRNSVSAKVTRCGAVQPAAVAKLQNSVDYYERLWERCPRRKRAGSRNSTDGEGSSKMKELKSKHDKKERRVLVIWSAVHEKSVCTLDT